ncbi:MAG TPA: response regulator transcription factor [Phycisphaerae bacterium]|nr:response regulator transcription factor [Phycisphaerales bacterium]HNO79942.1 response regulator transcription factor [Phycisphaerae bacterium]
MDSKTTILLADDHALLRDALRDRLRSEPDFEVVGVTSDGEEAISEAARLKPDVILMDIDMPGTICFEAAKTIKSISPHTRVIYVSAFFNDRYIESALAANASGYITKDEAPEIVIEAIRRAAKGFAYFSSKVQSRLVVDGAGVRLQSSSKSRASMLTERELEVLRYVARGMSKKEIAKVMVIAVKTVDRHCANLMSKLEIHDRVALARFAIREGLAEA